jgi:Fe2+ transport system protein B
LLLFVGALLLSMVAGFKIGENKISLLPFQLEHPEWLTHILFVVVLFYLFQFSLQWAAQLSEIQKNRFHRIDFRAITTITVGSILFYVGWLGAPYVQKITDMLSTASKGAALLANALLFPFILAFALYRLSISYEPPLISVESLETVRHPKTRK